MKATVVVPTFNRSGRLRALLHCLTRQDPASLARVVVCDDGSSDDTEAVARSFEPSLPLVYCRQDDLGFRAGQARNLGIAKALGDVVIFLDDDLVVAKDFVAAHLSAHEAAAGSGRTIAIGYRHRTFDPVEDVPSWDAIVASEQDDRVEDLGPDGRGIGDHPTPWFFVYSCNFSVTLDAALPRYDEDFTGWGMEDIEFGYRLNHAGYRVVEAPRARALHVEDPQPRDPFRCETRALAPTYDSYVRNSIFFMDKYPGDPVLASLVRQSLRWYVRDEARGAWVKNGYANDVDVVIAHCRREREQLRASRERLVAAVQPGETRAAGE